MSVRLMLFTPVHPVKLLKYTLYDGPDTLITNKLPELGRLI